MNVEKNNGLRVMSFLTDDPSILRHEIWQVKSTLLDGKRILFCLTGSIAVLEAIQVIREVIRHGGDPIVAISQAAAELITPTAVEWATKRKPILEITGLAEHVVLTSDPRYQVDACVVMPATVSIVGKLANGIADTTISLILASVLGRSIPLIMIPTAHEHLQENPSWKRNKQWLEEQGVIFIEPRREEGKAKLPPKEEIVDALITFLRISHEMPLKGKKVLITGGATREYIDDVRFISNPSSGKTAVALARVASHLGAEVTLVLGEGHVVSPPMACHAIEVTSANEMASTVLSILSREPHDLFISAAAIADYMPHKQEGKISSGKQDLVLELQPTRKVIKEVRENFPNLFIVGFKSLVNVGMNELIRHASAQMHRDGLDLMVANEVRRTKKGFATDDNTVCIITPDGHETTVSASKSEIAREIFQEILRELSRKGVISSSKKRISQQHDTDTEKPSTSGELLARSPGTFVD